MTYPITTGAENFYAYYGTPIGMNHGKVTMKDPVNPAHLQRAVETAMQRFPYYRTKPVLKDGTYFLEENDRPYVIYHGDKPLAPGSEEMNGYLTTFGYNGNEIYCDFFAGAAGGRGAMALAQSVIYYYCVYHYNDGRPMYCPGVMLADAPVDPLEYADPYSFSALPEEPVELLSAPDGFVLPEERIPSGQPQTLYSISMPQDAFIKYTKDHDGSPAVMTALLLCRAIDAVHPKRDKPIAIFMPVDASAALGCKNNMQNCLSDMHLIYSDRLKKLPLETQATCYRGMSFLQASPEVLQEVFAKRKAMYERVMQQDTLEAKRSVYMTWAPRYVLPAVSYVGRMDFGEVDQYRGAFRCCYDASVKGIIAEAFPSGDRLIISIAYGLKDDVYYRALLQQLEEAGIPFETGPVDHFIPMERKF